MMFLARGGGGGGRDVSGWETGAGYVSLGTSLPFDDF